MNDEALDQQLRTLFESSIFDVEVDSEAARALFEEITAMTWTSTEPFASIGEPVLSVEAASSGARPERSTPSRMVLVAAVGLFVAVLGLASWAMGDVRETPVLSDGVLEDGATETPNTAGLDGKSGVEELVYVDGPGQALLTVISPELEGREDEITKCAQVQRNMFGSGEPAQSLSVAFATVFASEGLFSPEVIFVDEGFTESMCSSATSLGNSTSSTSDVFRVDDSSVVVLGSGTRTNTDRDQRQSFSIQGLLGAEVEVVRVVEIPQDSQVFRRYDDRFIIDGFGAFDPDNAQFEILDSGGATSLKTGDELVMAPLCGVDRACQTAEIVSLASRANVQGAIAQFQVLEDGVVEQAEYDTRLASFERCLLALSSVQLDIPAIVVDGSRDAASGIACHDAEIAFVDQAVVLQNFFVGIPSEEQSVSVIEPDHNLVVFLEAAATGSEIAEVHGHLDEAGASFRFVSKVETYAEFVEFFDDDPALLDTISIETMPPSFRVHFDEGVEADLALIGFLETLPQVQTVVFGSDAIRQMESWPLSPYQLVE